MTGAVGGNGPASAGGVEAWGVVTAGEFQGPVLVDGFNITSVTDLGSTFQVNVGADLANTSYAVVATFGPGLGAGGPNPTDGFIICTAQGAGTFTLEAVSHAGATQSIAGGLDTKVYFAVVGQQ